MSTRIIMCLTIAVSAIFTIAVNELVLAEPNNEVIQSNITLPENMTKVLQLQVNFTNEEFDLDTLHKQGYVIIAHIKSDNYSHKMVFPISDYLAKNPILTIPIMNNGSDIDDGGDFRIDVSINQFDDRYKIINYPISKNTTFGSVNINDMLNYVIADEKEEGNYIDDQGDGIEEMELEYALHRGDT